MPTLNQAVLEVMRKRFNPTDPLVQRIVFGGEELKFEQIPEECYGDRDSDQARQFFCLFKHWVRITTQDLEWIKENLLELKGEKVLTA